MKQTLYENMMKRAAKCQQNACRCETEWSQKFWKDTASRITLQAMSLSVLEANSILKL